MADPIRIRARLNDGITDVQILMPHPMETGLRHDGSGQAVPAHYITDMTVRLAERTVFSARMSIAVSRDPLLAFRFKGARIGDRLQVSWTDSMGQVRADTALVA
jgi:sulfur-oxidizing protein SoxZ